MNVLPCLISLCMPALLSLCALALSLLNLTPASPVRLPTVSRTLLHYYRFHGRCRVPGDLRPILTLHV